MGNDYYGYQAQGGAAPPPPPPPTAPPQADLPPGAVRLPDGTIRLQNGNITDQKALDDARASGGTATGVSPASWAKWQAYRQQLATYREIQSHGGNPGPPPAPPSPQDTPDAYPSSTQFIEPNTAGGGNNPLGATVNGTEPSSAFSGGARPDVVTFTPPNAGGATSTEGLDADHQRAVDLQTQLLNERSAAGNFAAPQVQTRDVSAPAPVQTQTLNGEQILDTQGQQIRGQQVDYLQALRDRVAGKAPSVAEEQQRRGLDQLAAQQSGLAAQAHGNQGVFARREAMRNIAGVGQKTTLDAALLRAQESATAAGQLGTALQGVRTTDTATAQREAELRQQAGLANQAETGTNERFNAAEQTTVATGNAERDVGVQTGNANRDVTAHGQNVEEKQGLANEALTAGGQATDATKAAADIAERGKERQAATERVRYAADKQQSNAVLGGVLGGLATAGAAYANYKGITDAATAGTAIISDRRLKTDVKRDSDEDVRDFLVALEAVQYRYKPGAGPPGERYGVLAQDLEKSAIGRSVVKTDPRGVKTVDPEGLTLALAGVLARVARDKRRGR